MAAIDTDDLYLRDLGLTYSKSSTSTSTESAFLNDLNQDATFDSILDEDELKKAKILKAYDGNIAIAIKKENTGFDFADRFKQYLQNPEFKTNSNLISFFQSSSNEIGKVIYERVQNFLNNIINIDSCQYKALLSYYDTDDIDIKTVLTANLPEKLEYLINVFSVSKLYFKNNFYNLSIQDDAISNYINTDFKDTTDIYAKLKLTEEILNEKYFANFYQSVVYPIIREELYKNYEDEEIQKYIEQSTSGVYDKCYSGTNYEYYFNKFVITTTSNKTLEYFCDVAKSNLENYIKFTYPDAAWPTKDYFRYIFANLPSNDTIKDDDEKLVYQYIDIEKAPSDMVLWEYSSSNNLENAIENIKKFENDINLLSPNFRDIFNIITRFIISKESVLKSARIKLTAQKLANICNSICKLREEIKNIRVKDSKIGTAALIEELICEFVYKNFTKKIGITNQAKVPNTLYDLKSEIDRMFKSDEGDASIHKILSDMFFAEQKTIGVEYDSNTTNTNFLLTLKEMLSVFDAEIVEYIDNTSAYLNIIPEEGEIEIEEKYKVEETQYTPYLNVNGLAVYADWKDTTNYTMNVNQIQQRSEPKVDAVNPETDRNYYIKDSGDVPLIINELGQVTDIEGKVWYCPEGSNVYELAPNLSKAEYLDSYKLFEIKETRKVVDLFDRLITHTVYKKLVDANDSPVIEWINDVKQPDYKFVYIASIMPSGFIEYDTKMSLQMEEYIGENSKKVQKWYLYQNPNTGELYQIYKEGPKEGSPDVYYTGISQVEYNKLTKPEEKKKYQVDIEDYKKLYFVDTRINTENLTEIDYIYPSIYIQYGDGSIIDTKVNQYQFAYSETYVLDETGEELGYTEAKQLYNSEGLILNNYVSDLEKFYAIENAKTAIIEKSKFSKKALTGNTPFWTELSVKEFYQDLTADDEYEIIKFYRRIGLIDDTKIESKIYKASNGEDLKLEWMLARENIINNLKEIWKANAPHRWFNPVVDQNRLEKGQIDQIKVDELKEMDFLYHSNLGPNYENKLTVPVENSITNLANYENNTIAVHPCVWNLVEKSYQTYLRLYTLSFYGDKILNKIYKNARTFGESHISVIDEDGLLAFTSDNSQAHIIDYWKEYSKSFFGYSTEYQMLTNKIEGNLNIGALSRFKDFDGPFNYEGLQELLTHNWFSSNKMGSDEFKIGSIREIDISRYYIDIDV